MNTKLLIPAPALLFLFATAATAAETAPWYLWDSAPDGKTQCAQFSPGKDWVKIEGVYRNSSCSTRQREAMERRQKLLKVMGIYITTRPGK